nr:unnamed protein product [Callosobruchus analis]
MVKNKSETGTTAVECKYYYPKQVGALALPYFVPNEIEPCLGYQYFQEINI